MTDYSSTSRCGPLGINVNFFLVDHEKLRPRLDALIAAHHEDLVLAASLEKRIATLMDRHATYVSRLYNS